MTRAAGPVAGRGRRPVGATRVPRPPRRRRPDRGDDGRDHHRRPTRWWRLRWRRLRRRLGPDVIRWLRIRRRIHGGRRPVLTATIAKMVDAAAHHALVSRRVDALIILSM